MIWVGDSAFSAWDEVARIDELLRGVSYVAREDRSLCISSS